MAKVVDTRKLPMVRDAARPFAIIIGKTVIGRYETEEKAKRRMHNLLVRA